MLLAPDVAPTSCDVAPHCVQKVSPGETSWPLAHVGDPPGVGAVRTPHTEQ